MTTHAAFIGGGNMARALLDGASRAGLDPGRFTVAEPDAGKHHGLPSPVRTPAEALARLQQREPSPGSGQLVLAVKPQMLGAVAQLAPLLASEGPGRVIVSILAGTPSAKVRSVLDPRARVVRVMPNTPARVGRGMAAIALGEGAEPGDEALAIELLSASGKTTRIPESLMDAYTALAGSGPAYVFYLAEAMARAGEALGFGPEQADEITRQTIAGAAELLVHAADETSGALRAAVTSKGGTTAAATSVFDDAGLAETIELALRAARDRGRELAEG